MVSLDEKVDQALNHFREKFPLFHGQSVIRNHKISVAISRCLFTPKVLPVFNQLFFSVIKYVGKCVIEDDKLFKFGGDGPVLYEQNRPDVKELCFYKLMVFLKTDLPFCCGINMYHKVKRDDPVPMLSVVTEWLEAIEPKLSSSHKTCLDIDCHYRS